MHTNSHPEPVGSPTILMMTDPLRYLPRARHHATICTAGSKGYCAVKEMLQSGAPGHTLLIESGDLRNVENSVKECCLIYTCSPDDHHSYSDHFPATVEHLAVYSNSAYMPPVLLTNVGMRSVDLSPLTRVTEVQEYFFEGCAGLTTLDLSPLSQVTVLQEYFLLGCSGLTTLDLSPLYQLTVIHGNFLVGCSGLMTLDLSGLSQVKEVRGYFLAGCSGLTTLDLSPLSQVTEVSSGFLEKCSGLTRLDLSSLSRLTSISFYSFLEGCTSLDAVISPPRCPPPIGWTVRTTNVDAANRTMDTSTWVRE